MVPNHNAITQALLTQMPSHPASSAACTHQAELPLVLREFQKCGDVVRFDNFAQGSSVNWIHLQYQVLLCPDAPCLT